MDFLKKIFYWWWTRPAPDFDDDDGQDARQIYGDDRWPWDYYSLPKDISGD